MKRNYTLIIALALISIALTLNAVAQEPRALEPSFNQIKVWHMVTNESSATYAKILTEIGDNWYGSVHVAHASGLAFTEVDFGYRWYATDHVAIFGGGAWRRIWVDDEGHEDDWIPEIGVAVGFNQYLEGRLDAGYNIIKDESWRPHSYWHFNAELEYHVRQIEGLGFTASVHHDVYNDLSRVGLGLAYHW